MSNYCPQPSHPAPAAGVLVLHAWWGLTPFFRSFCDRLAAEDFRVLAPDLYNGATASTIPQAEKLRSTLKRQQVLAQIQVSAAELRALAGSEQIGLVGFSLGAYYGMWLADIDPSIAALVAFYGIRQGEYTACRAAFQFHLAHPDPYVSDSGGKSLEKSLKAAARPAEFFHYPDTGHWFFESDQPAYHPAFAQAAWTRAVYFLKRNLTVK